MVVRANGVDVPPGHAGPEVGGAQAPPRGSPSLDEWLVDLTAVGGEVLRLFEVRADRGRLAMRRGLARGALIAPLVVAALVAAVRAGWWIAGGIAGACAALVEGRAWLAELLGGSVIVLSIAALVWLSERRADRRDLRRMERKYADSEQPDPGDTASAEARSGVA